jgi:hypothetical protein
MDLDLAQVTRAYVNLRDARAKLREDYDKSDADLKSAQTRLEGVMLDHLNKHGMNTVATDAGTFYRQEEIKPNCADWTGLFDWIKDNDAWDVLERRVKKTFIKEYMEAHDGALPPGISVFKEYVVRVRRPS